MTANSISAAPLKLDGTFEFCVGSGDVDVTIANNGRGFVGTANFDNPRFPGRVFVNASTTVRWTSADGPLVLTVPTTVLVQIHVSSAGEDVQGASVNCDDSESPTILVDDFLVAPGVLAVGVAVQAGLGTTDASGFAFIPVWPSAASNVLACAVSQNVNGVNLRRTFEAAITGDVVHEVVMPDPPQLLTGSLTNGATGISGGIAIEASNSDGFAQGEVDSNGDFSFFVPGGTVDVRPRNGGRGFIGTGDFGNVLFPGRVFDLPSVPWTFADGPLQFLVPATILVPVHVTSGGVDVVGARVDCDDSASPTLFAADFTLHVATDTIASGVPVQAASGATNADGFAFIPMWPSNDSLECRVTQTVDGVSLRRTMIAPVTETTVELAMPEPPQLLTGTLRDLSGAVVTTPTSQITVEAENSDGFSQGPIAADGSFSFSVPAGTVNVRLRNGGRGFIGTGTFDNPAFPGRVFDLPAVSWTLDNGALAFTVPATILVPVHVTNGGDDVVGARVDCDDSASPTLIAADFTLHVATDTTIASGVPVQAASGSTNADGIALIPMWPSQDSLSCAVSQIVDGVNLRRSFSTAVQAQTVEVELNGGPS